MLTVEDLNKITRAAVEGVPVTDLGLPDTDEVRAKYDSAVAWAESLPEGAEAAMVSEWPDADLDTESLYSQSAAEMAADIFGDDGDGGGGGAPAPTEPPTPAPAEAKAAGGADRNRGGAEKLRRYWVRGEGAAKIGWGTPGDWSRCVALLTEHMGARAKGYCNLRHHDALGYYPGEHDGKKTGVPFVDTKGLLQFKKAGLLDPEPASNPMPDGVMVALYAPHDVASDLAMDGGTHPTDMHVTLAYLGKADEVGDPAVLHDVVSEFAASHPPVDARISGVGRFVGNDEGDAVYLSVDSPTLPELRAQLVAALEEAGLEVRKDHGFTPHMTLGYLDPTDENPIDSVEPASTQFGLLSMAYGPDVWDYPMGADE